MRPLRLVIALAWLIPAAARADDRYRPAPEAVHGVLHAPAVPSVDVSPDGRFAVWARPALYPPIAELAAPMLRLAGVRIDPRNNGFHAWGHYEGGFTLTSCPTARRLRS